MEIEGYNIIRPINETHFNIPEIVDSINSEQITNFQPVFERYYESRYFNKFTTDKQNIDTCIRTHTNKVSAIYLSPKHSVIERKQRIKNINFHVSNKLDRLANTTKGKGKKGAQLLKPDSILCFVETEDEVKYPVYAGIHGKLLEINEDITCKPNLLIDDYYCSGFVALILPEAKHFENDIKSLILKHDYLI